MKIVVYGWLALVLLACSDEYERYPVQGKWQIERIIYQREGKADLVVTTDLGTIAFNECSQANNKHLTCTGQRDYTDGKSDSFHWRTRRNVRNDQPVKIIELGYDGHRVENELVGQYHIDTLTDKKLIISCTGCSVGNFPDRLTRFELRATKVSE